MNKRGWQALGSLAAVTAVAVGSYLVGVHTQSGQQAAAHAGSVRRTQLTAPVTSRVLSANVVFRVNYQAGPVSQIASVPAPADGADPIVTSVAVAAGDPVKPGQVMISIADQPVFALPGSLPMYRDIQAGDSGSDVKQLQKALISTGYLTAAATGTFDATTARAIQDLWRNSGYSAPTSASTPPTSTRKAASVIVPKGSIAYFRSLPVTVAKVETRRGQLLKAGENWVSIRTGRPALTAQIPVADNTQLHAGDSVELTDDTTSATAPSTIASIGSPTAADDGSGQVLPATIALTGRNPFEVGSNLRGNIILKSTNRVVLSVPTVAIRSASDGSLYVIRADRGSQTRVEVSVGLAANGYTQITSSTPKLTSGEQIAVN